MYEYRATVVRVVDGDTVHAVVDVGFDIHIGMKLRLFGINAPEMNTDAGKAARQHLLDMVGSPTVPLTIRTVKDRQEKYGRYLATLIRADGVNLNEQMILDGHAVRYMA